MSDISERIVALQKMTTAELRRTWRRLLGEEPRSFNRDWLRKRLAWAIQVQEFGGLSEMAKGRIEELTAEAQLWMPLGRTAFAGFGGSFQAAPRTLERIYRGRTLAVIVREEGYEFEGKIYPSLTAIAKTVTGSHCSGPRFFGTQRKRSS